jgi:predicted nucleic-acid-binding Zn-ribbon protein
MAQSKCLGCGHDQFERKRVSITGTKHQLNLVQCSKCGGAIGVLEENSAAVLVNELAKEVRKLRVKAG